MYTEIAIFPPFAIRLFNVVSRNTSPTINFPSSVTSLNATGTTFGLEEIRKPLPMRPGDIQKIDSEYVQNDTSYIFVFVEPLSGIRYVNTENTVLQFITDNAKNKLVSLYSKFGPVEER